jgi:hypothetical protein
LTTTPSSRSIAGYDIMLKVKGMIKYHSFSCLICSLGLFDDLRSTGALHKRESTKQREKGYFDSALKVDQTSSCGIKATYSVMATL